MFASNSIYPPDEKSEDYWQKRKQAAAQILNYWRKQRAYKQANPFVKLNPWHGESLQKTVNPRLPSSRSYNIPSAGNDISKWLIHLLEDLEVGHTAYRKQFSSETRIFYDTLKLAQYASDIKTSEQNYKEILANPYFIYEVTNLFMLGYLSEFIFMYYIEIFAIFRQYKILIIHDNKNIELIEEAYRDIEFGIIGSVNNFV